jgi:hypothetical protein
MTDAAASSANRSLAGGPLTRDVEFLMQRQDQRRVFRDPQIVRRDDDTLLFKVRDLAQQRVWIEHHTVADDRQLPRPHDARGQQRQLVRRAVDHQRMAGIVPALETDDDVGLLREPIDNLAFALVAPLGADHDDICHEGCVLKGPMMTRVVRSPAAAARSDTG